MNITEACRLCLAKSAKATKEIFFPIDEDFERKFSELTNFPLDLNNEIYPVTVCNTCITRFEEFYSYRRALIEKQKRLNHLLGIKKPHPVKKSVIEEVKATAAAAADEEALVQNEQLMLDEKEGEGEYAEQQELDYHDEGEYERQEEEPSVINYEEILHNEDGVAAETEEEHALAEEEEEYEIDDSEMQQHQDYEIYQGEEEVEEYIDSDEYIEEMDQTEGEAGLYEITGESDIDQIAGTCIIVKTENAFTGVVTSKESNRKKRKYEKSNTKDRPYKCWEDNCEAAFTHRSSINKHMQLAHNVKCDKNTCMMCGKKFSLYADFLSHVKTHTRKSECDICKLTFVTVEKMQAHRVRVHQNDSDDRKFKCPLCDAMFKRKEHLNSHITYRHTEQSDARRHTCDECDSIFLTRQDLKNHHKSHTQQKKACCYCNYECRDLKSIKLHCLKIHKTNKIYQCGCGDAFELFKEYQSHKKNCYRVVDSTTKCENE